ncbi:hypothetical protein SAMN05421824_1045 [Hyunsoonleella jejuensis]|uniref:Uncharacterized protein n=1 Tax=Hyunsoonleella jejuensis TaxID=419940 RepID=A0A1H9CX15_9FLAO|nr:hypothetical protein SAMN05421824_1045 [Hyunsoonleella jejuensis]
MKKICEICQKLKKMNNQISYGIKRITKNGISKRKLVFLTLYLACI